MTDHSMLIADLSWGHDSITGPQLVAAGFGGVIAYIGCDDTTKNATAANLAGWRAAGLLVGLVIENGPQDLLGGQKVGAYQGQRAVAGAQLAGYPPGCVLFAAADWHVTPTQFSVVDAAIDAFHTEVRAAGYLSGLYGPGPLLNYALADCYWNSSSTSFGPVSAQAHLVQRVANPTGLAVDVNNVIRTPLHLWGENIMTQPLDTGGTFNADWTLPMPPHNKPATDTGARMFDYLADLWVLANRIDAAITELANTIANLPANTGGVIPLGYTGTVDLHAVTPAP